MRDKGQVHKIRGARWYFHGVQPAGDIRRVVPRAMIEGRDIHELPPVQWGELNPDLVGGVVEVRIVCVHAFGAGVQLTSHGAYGHVNPPCVTDGRFTVEEASVHIGEVRRALLLAVVPGRQPTLTIRPSEVPMA